MKSLTLQVFLLVFTGLLVAHCSGREISEADLRNLYITDTGLLAGVDIGDQWTEARKNVPADWELEEDTPGSVRYGDSYYDIDESRCFLEVQLESGAVVGISAGVFSQARDKSILRSFYRTLKERIDSKAQSDGAGWYKYIKQDQVYQIRLDYRDSEAEPYIALDIMKR